MSARTDYSERRGRTGRKTIRHSRRQTTTSPTSPWLIYVASGSSLVLSFLITLYLTKPIKPLSPSVATLARSFVSDSRTLMAAVRAAGLKGSPQVKGAIDDVKRLDDDRVSVEGWAAEMGNSATSLMVIVFADGQAKLTIETAGEHPNVIPVLGLSDTPTAANVSFRGTLTCNRGQKLIVVAVTPSNDYGYFGSRACP